MEAPSNLLSFEGLSCIAYNYDYSQCIISKKDKNLYIYEVANEIDKAKEYKLIHTLKSHFEYISSVDWHQKTNRIISASYDKNIYIWEYEKDINQWKPRFVNFVSRLSVLTVKWSTDGDKFCAATGGKYVLLGFYDKEKEWWKAEEIKCHRSAVTSACFDPSGLFLISGSLELKIAIHSAYLEKIDENKSLTCYFPEEDFKTKCKSDVYVAKVSAWVNDVACSLNGEYTFAVAHDATFYVIKNKTLQLNKINLRHNACSKIIALEDDKVVLISYDRELFKYELVNEEWTLTNTLTNNFNIPSKSMTNLMDNSTNNNESLDVSEKVNSVFSRMKMFDVSHQLKKNSLIRNDVDINCLISKNIHNANICGYVLNEKNNQIITADLAGFIKTYIV